MDIAIIIILSPLIIAWIADRVLGDPPFLPHPIVGFGKIISWGEKKLNKGKDRKVKGGLFSLALILSSFCSMYFLLKGSTYINTILTVVLSAIVIFFCLAGKTLIDEVKNVFIALNISTEDGRKQVARIVGRDTSNLSPQQIRKAALETLSENLSDGVIAPLFWFALLGVPGMFAYKMINTLDSMIGYKNERYGDFGCWAAHIDDITNYVPARLTSFLMIIVSGKLSLFSFVKKYGRQHASPNSGYPESALSGILNCRFGGSNVYFGNIVEKPYIGDNDKTLTDQDMEIAISINRKVEVCMIALIIICIVLFNFLV